MRPGKRNAIKAYKAEYVHNFASVDHTPLTSEKTETIQVKSYSGELFKTTYVEMTLPVMETERKPKPATHKNCKGEAKANGIKDALTCANVATEKALYSGGKTHYSHDLHTVENNDFGVSLANKWTARNKATDTIRRANSIGYLH